jgi:hypothetical protein
MIKYNLSVKISSDDGEKATPVPIPNTMVKLLSADGTARETEWKSRTLLGHLDL